MDPTTTVTDFSLGAELALFENSRVCPMGALPIPLQYEEPMGIFGQWSGQGGNIQRGREAYTVYSKRRRAMEH